MTDPDLSAAYALAGPEDCRHLYAAWADSYDTDFTAGMDYVMPARVAAAFVAAQGAGLDAGQEAGPVLDVGAGTGLLGAALRGLGFAGAWNSLDFVAALQGLPITGLDTALAPIYGPRAAARDPAHAADRALIVTFRTTGPP